MKIVGLLGAKQYSKRLPKKGWLDFNGKPMFLWGVEKGLKTFNEMYVSSDYDYILDKSEQVGAMPIKRTDPSLMDCPNITYYRHAFEYMGNPDAIVAIQVNSPTVDFKAIEAVKKLLELGYQEIKTCHSDYSDYGSVWGMTKERLFNYPDPYNAKPDIWIVENSIDIHTEEELELAKKQI